MPAATFANEAAAGLAQGFVEIRARSAKRGRQARQDAGSRGDASHIAENPPVKGKTEAKREVAKGAHLFECVADPHAEQRTCGAASNREDDAFGKHLADQAKASRAH